jgi:mannose/cellobiose epimerase-like protein (N-acyl-D-glucosamine 2-epimerase family)
MRIKKMVIGATAIFTLLIIPSATVIIGQASTTQAQAATAVKSSDIAKAISGKEYIFPIDNQMSLTSMSIKILSNNHADISVTSYDQTITYSMGLNGKFIENIVPVADGSKLKIYIKASWSKNNHFIATYKEGSNGKEITFVDISFDKDTISVSAPTKSGIITAKGCIKTSKNSYMVLKDYDVKSTFLKNPDSIKPYADKSAKFWEKAYDSENGGFNTYIKQDGSVDTSKSDHKVTFIQSRDVYGMVRAYQLTGKTEYLDYARKALDYMYKHCWDTKNDGWYQELNKDGTAATKPAEGYDYTSKKWSFNQHYALVGIGAIYDATRSDNDLSWLTKGFDATDKHLWDSTKGKEGYYITANLDWSNPKDKGFTPTVDGITTNMEALCLLTHDDKYKTRLEQMAGNILDHLIPSMKSRKFGFVENYDNNWIADPDENSVSIGHMVKTAWCLGRVYLLNPKPEYKAAADKLLTNVLKDGGYDYTYGGTYTSMDSKTGNVISMQKEWWTLEQGFTGGLTNYYISNNYNYLKLADESLDFFMKHMYDTKYNEVYPYTNLDGSNPDTTKGNYYKGGYHSIELFYYTYLYGNLYYQKKPASLYYDIQPTNKAKKITLDPIPYEKNKLIISEVTLDGKPYKNYDGATRTLNISQNIGGNFKVTYSPLK